MRPSIGVELCEALGLDPERVRSLNIDLAAGELAGAYVEMVVDKDDGRMVEALKRYRLTWAPPTGPPANDPFGFLEE